MTLIFARMWGHEHSSHSRILVLVWIRAVGLRLLIRQCERSLFRS